MNSGLIAWGRLDSGQIWGSAQVDLDSTEVVNKLLLRIFGPEFIRINSFITRFRKNSGNYENVTLVARLREHFRVFLAIFLVAQLPPKRGVLVHKNSLVSCQRCYYSVEPRALTCPFKQSNLSAWSRCF